MNIRPDLIQTIERIGNISVPDGVEGRGVKIRCPFHEEKTPSLQIYPDQHWYCFGCNLGGNVYDFVGYLVEGQNWEKKDIEMFRRIADITRGEHIPYVQIRRGKNQELPEPSPEILEILGWAANEYRQRLWQKPGERGREYLYSRGYSDEIIEELHIGYAAPRTLKNASLKFSREERSKYLERLMQIGLIDENGREYFYNRVIFPNLGDKSNVYNLTGRDIRAESNLRYLNLRGLRRQIYLLGLCDPSQPIYLTESVSDTISLRQMGLQGVGVCGVNLSKYMKSTLSDFQQIFIVPQNDDPSRNAAKEWCLEIKRAKILSIPYETGIEKDINDIVTKEGLLKAKAKIRNAKLLTLKEFVGN